MSLLHIAGGATEDKLYVEDVFSTYLYTGNGSTQTINNGIDLAGKGGLVWIKSRTQAAGHILTDTLRGPTKYILSSGTDSEYTNAASLTQFNSNGFNLGSMGGVNTSGANHVSWTFRKAPKFFDVVTYTGDGVSVRQIPHSLGIAAGMVICKNCTTSGYDWGVWHRSLGTRYFLNLNLTSAKVSSTLEFPVDADASVFTVGVNENQSGATYVAYLFAHDPSADGIIQCGSFTHVADIKEVIDLGFEPQYILSKNTTTASHWQVFDNLRGITSTESPHIVANEPATEQAGSFINLQSNGFSIANAAMQAGAYIYLAIRRPMKTPTSGTEVYNAIARTGTGAAEEFNVGIVPDLVFVKNRPTSTSTYWTICDRLRAFSSATAGVLSSNATASEFYAIPSNAGVLLDGKTSKNVQYTSGSTNTNITGIEAIHHFFKRAKGFMDIVCYTGTGVARTVNHNLGVVPELMIVKGRTTANSWIVYHNTATGNDKALRMEQTIAVTSANIVYWNNTNPTESLFTAGTTIAGAYNYVAYLFATLAGISKVGSYTGNGTSQTINCGFSTGARFILIKRTDATGDWYIWDTARGIVAANDPHLSLNTTSAEVTTDDSIDPHTSGFIVNQNTATNINVNGASYIFLAIA